ncbi:hypothetical protein I7I48_04050 [Histoplasma ohiense]|nr:hypothetical protein I7I48_04050 [Histoplasma ohiense (nom. inval.)]
MSCCGAAGLLIVVISWLMALGKPQLQLSIRGRPQRANDADHGHDPSTHPSLAATNREPSHGTAIDSIPCQIFSSAIKR